MPEIESPQPMITPDVEERALANVIGPALRAGVVLSAFIVAAGYVLLVRHGLPLREYRHFTGKPITGRWGLLDVLLSLRDRHAPEDIVTFGLLLLILTPVLRVAMSLVVFLYEKDRLYASLTGIVLAVLIVSLLGGL